MKLGKGCFETSLNHDRPSDGSERRPKDEHETKGTVLRAKASSPSGIF